VDLHKIPKLCFEGERSWKRGLVCWQQLRTNQVSGTDFPGPSRYQFLSHQQVQKPPGTPVTRTGETVPHSLHSSDEVDLRDSLLTYDISLHLKDAQARIPPG
jgi:hypothetical protein